MASGSVELAVQKAVLDALGGLTTPSATTGGDDVVVPVYDAEPQNAAYPFVAIASQVMAPDDAYDADYGVHIVYLEVRSQYHGRRQLLAIMGEIRARLHKASLQLDDGESLLCRVTNMVSQREPDRITFQGAVTVTVTAGH